MGAERDIHALRHRRRRQGIHRPRDHAGRLDLRRPHRRIRTDAVPGAELGQGIVHGHLRRGHRPLLLHRVRGGLRRPQDAAVHRRRRPRPGAGDAVHRRGLRQGAQIVRVLHAGRQARDRRGDLLRVLRMALFVPAAEIVQGVQRPERGQDDHVAFDGMVRLLRHGRPFRAADALRIGFRRLIYHRERDRPRVRFRVVRVQVHYGVQRHRHEHLHQDQPLRIAVRRLQRAGLLRRGVLVDHGHVAGGLRRHRRLHPLVVLPGQGVRHRDRSADVQHGRLRPFGDGLGAVLPVLHRVVLHVAACDSPGAHVPPDPDGDNRRDTGRVHILPTAISAFTLFYPGFASIKMVCKGWQAG